MFNQNIYLFISVVEKGSFSAAGKEHYISQSAVSQQIDKLEKQFSFKLFDRSQYRPTLTTQGEYFYKACKSLINEGNQALAYAQSMSMQQNLAIAITGPFEKKYLPDIINDYKIDYPNVEISIKIHNFINCVRLLEEGKVDLAFGIMNDFQGRKELKVIEIYKHHVCVVCSKSHPFSTRTSIIPQEIIGVPIVTLSKNIGNNFYEDFMKSFALDGITPNIVKEVDDLSELLLSLKLNEGIALLAKEVISIEDEVCIIDIKNTHHHASFCLGYKSNNNKPYLAPLVNKIELAFKKL